MTQTDVDNAVNAIVNQYTGQTIAYYGTYPGECTVPVADYVEKLTGHSPVPSMAGARADGWGVSFPTALAPFFTHEAYQAGKVYPRGTILMWNSPHTAIVLHGDGSNTVQVFEQNADPDGSACGTKSRVINNSYHTCTYALIPIVTADAPPAPAYTLEPFDPRTMQLTSNASIWDLTTPQANVAVANYDNGYQFTAQGRALHQDGRTYYMPDVTVPHGFLEENCMDYVPPAPTPPPTTTIQNYTPQAVPPAQKYPLVTTVPTYDTAGNAATGVKPSGTFPAGPDYYIYDQQNGLYLLNITNMAQKASGKWVNGKDNVLPPAPPKPVATPVTDTTWKATFAPFDAVNYTEAKSGIAKFVPTVYVMEFGYRFADVSGYTNTTVPCSQYAEVPMSGIFEKDGKQWLRVYVEGDIEWQRWYGVPMTNPANGLPYALLEKQVYNDTTTTGERIALKRPTPYDRFIQLGAKFDKYYNKTVKTIEGIFRKK